MILSFIFGFDDKQPSLVISYWISNFIKILLFTAISLGLHVYIQKFLAKKYSCSASLDLWGIKRLGFKKEIKSSIPIGIILSVLIYILSKGQIFFAAITSLNITVNKAYTIGKKFTHLTNFESAKIAALGPLVNILLALIASPIPFMKLFVSINIAMALSYLLPLPKLDGGEVFFGSKPLYASLVIFICTIAAIMNFISIPFTLFLAAILSIVALVSYLYYTYK